MTIKETSTAKCFTCAWQSSGNWTTTYNSAKAHAKAKQHIVVVLDLQTPHRRHYIIK